VKPGDAIVELSGVEIRSSRGLKKAIEERRVGEAIGLKLYRGARQLELQVTLTEA